MLLEKDTFAAQVINDMGDGLSYDQAQKLRNLISIKLQKYNLVPVETGVIRAEDASNTAKAIKMFFVTKKIEGLSDKSLQYYKQILKKFFAHCHQAIEDIKTDDVRYYLAVQQTDRGISKVSCDNERRVLSSFFKWCEDEEYIFRSPMRKIKKIKQPKIIKQPFSDVELELLRDACINKRELAVIDVLASTGMRIGEMAGLKKKDVDFLADEVKVFGKGQKERITFLNAKAKIHLRDYLKDRNDNSQGVIVSMIPPYKNLMIGSLEKIVKTVGERSGVENVHPHRFRRTAATQAINRGMPIEQVRIMLGHEDIQTTTKYAIVDKKNVKISHEKYLN